MNIRTEQFGAFTKAVAENIECRLYAHVSRVFPRVCERLGEDEARGWVRKGIRGAREHGIEGEYDRMRYVDLVFALGPEFDTPLGPAWASELLGAPGLSATARMDALCQRAVESRESGG